MHAFSYIRRDRDLRQLAANFPSFQSADALSRMIPYGIFVTDDLREMQGEIASASAGCGQYLPEPGLRTLPYCAKVLTC